MFGGSRAAAYAGWGLPKPATFNASVTTTVYAGGHHNGYRSNDRNTLRSPEQSWNVGFDNVGITNDYGAVDILTFKVQTMDNYVWRPDEYRQNFDQINVSGIPGDLTTLNPAYMQLKTSDNLREYHGMQLCRNPNNGNLALLLGYTTYEVVPLPITWDSIAGRWVTAVVAYGSDGDFSNFASANSQWEGNKRARIHLYDARTGELLTSVDWNFNNFNYQITDRANRYWEYKNPWEGNGTENCINLALHSYANSEQSITDTKVLINTGWKSIGKPFDPAVVKTNAVGMVLPSTIGGVKSWINFTYDYRISSSSNIVLGMQYGCRATTPQHNSTGLYYLGGSYQVDPLLSGDTP